MLKVLYLFIIHILAVVGVLAVGLSAHSYLAIQELNHELSDLGSYRFDHFHQYIYLDHSINDLTADFPEPPEGAARLVGQVTRDGETVEGVVFNLFLNGKYSKKGVVSDSRGKFVLHVEPGEWVLNIVEVDGWKNRPSGTFEIISGFEPKFSAPHRYQFNQYSPVVIQVGANEEVELIDLKIEKPIEMVKPSTQSIAQLVIEDNIQWQPHPKAKKYRIAISSVEQKGTITTSHELAEYKVSSNLLKLSDLNLSRSDDASLRYRVEVYGYDASGAFVSKSDSIGQYQFTLSGHAINRKDTDVADLLDFSVTEQYIKNRERLSAVEQLIDDGLLAGAKNLLLLVVGDAPHEKVEALTGYLLASQGDCERAKRHLASARSIGGSGCIKQKYYSACE